MTMGMLIEGDPALFSPLVRRYAADMCPTANIRDTRRELMLR